MCVSVCVPLDVAMIDLYMCVIVWLSVSVGEKWKTVLLEEDCENIEDVLHLEGDEIEFGHYACMQSVDVYTCVCVCAGKWRESTSWAWAT